MSVLENFKNIPRSSYGGRHGSNVFFSSNLQRSPWRKKKEGACRPPPNGRQAPVAHPSGKQMTGKQNQHDLTDKHVLPFYHCNK